MSTGTIKKRFRLWRSSADSFYLYRRTGHLRCLAGTSDFV